MIKLIYQLFDGTGRIVEKEYSTLKKAVFEAKYVQYSATGQIIRIDDGNKVYHYEDIVKLW